MSLWNVAFRSAKVAVGNVAFRSAKVALPPQRERWHLFLGQS